MFLAPRFQDVRSAIEWRTFCHGGRFSNPRIILGMPLDEVVSGERSGYTEGATSVSVLRSVWQTYWHGANLNNAFDQIEQSLNQLEDRFKNFLQQLTEAGWDTNEITLKVYKGVSIEEFGSN